MPDIRVWRNSCDLFEWLMRNCACGWFIEGQNVFISSDRPKIYEIKRGIFGRPTKCDMLHFYFLHLPAPRITGFDVKCAGRICQRRAGGWSVWNIGPRSYRPAEISLVVFIPALAAISNPSTLTCFAWNQTRARKRKIWTRMKDIFVARTQLDVTQGRVAVSKDVERSR